MSEKNPAVVYVNGMTDEQIRERLSKIRCFLLDMDGTFYLGDHLLEGSLDFLDAVEATGRRVLFLTNNSSKSGDVYVKKLERMGVRETFRNILAASLLVMSVAAVAGLYMINRKKEF